MSAAGAARAQRRFRQSHTSPPAGAAAPVARVIPRHPDPRRVARVRLCRVPAVQGTRRTAWSPSTSRRAPRRRRSANMLERQGRHRQPRSSSASARASRASATSCARAASSLRKDMSYGAALDALTTAPAVAEDGQGDDPRGPLAPGGRPIVKQAGLTGDYLRRRNRSPALKPRARRPAVRAHARGLPVPGDLPAQAGRDRPRRSSTSSWRRSSDNFGKVDLAPRQAQEPDALRRPDHRLDDRARGAAAQGPPADRRGHLQPPASRACRSASTRRCATRCTTGPSR